MASWSELELDPDGARRRVADDMGQDWVKDPIYRSDALRAVHDEPELILRRLEQGILPQRGRAVPVPKSAFTIRPAVDLPALDRISYQTMVDSFAFDLLGELPEFVCGWRFALDAEGPDDLADNSHEWRRYQRLLDEHWNQGARYVLVADVAGFFQSIPHRLLRDRMDSAHPLVRNLISDYLRIWNPNEIGLPQRVLGSSLLANAYLESVDAVLSDYRAIRWMDDITVFADSRREAIEALLRTQAALAPLNLFLNDAKTFLVPYADAEAVILDRRLRAIQYHLRQGKPGEDFHEEGLRELSAVWDELTATPDTADRTRFSFCVTRFAEIQYDAGQAEVLNLLPRLPHVSDHVSRYLRSALDDRETLARVTRFLRGRNNLYRWQEYRLATLYWHADRVTPRELQFVRSRAASPNTYWAARSIYARALARHGTRNDALRIGEMAEAEMDKEVLRGLIIAGAESQHISERRLRTAGRDDADLLRLVTYLRAREWEVPPLSF